MQKAKIVPFDPEKHMDGYIEIYTDYITWFSQQFIEYNNRDAPGGWIIGNISKRFRKNLCKKRNNKICDQQNNDW